jgi:hypothetical protein
MGEIGKERKLKLECGLLPVEEQIKVILNWQRPLWEKAQEVLKRSGRNEPMWVAIHKCMEATLGISLHSYL